MTAEVTKAEDDDAEGMEESDSEFQPSTTMLEGNSRDTLTSDIEIVRAQVVVPPTQAPEPTASSIQNQSQSGSAMETEVC